jgi:hypothetical protein
MFAMQLPGFRNILASNDVRLALAHGRTRMKILAFVAAVSAAAINCAYAETTVIHRDAGPSGIAVVGGPVEHRTTVIKPGVGCEHTTVRKENEMGSKTVKKTDC